ncbi:MAG: tetratricopeptide repeat protein, partial [Candidatus Omnitrophica bacterium]|nr:tetratricopeptide repeat protein [Candidatus Omnitrophota bacterium]
MKKKLSLLMLLLIVGTAIYSNSLHSAFQFDDTPFIVDNVTIRDLSDVGTIWKGVLPQHSRFVAFYSFALNYHFHKLDVFGYHVTNLAIHLISAILVWWLVFLLISTPGVKDEKSLKHKGSISFLAGLLFVCHPVQTQAVVYITQRFASMATMFYLLAVCLYLYARSLKQRGFVIIALSYFGSCIAALLGMFTKEIAITIPLTLIIIEFMFLNPGKNLRDLLVGFKKGNRWVFIVIILLSLLIIPQQFDFSVKNQLFAEKVSNSHDGDIITFGKYFMTQFRVAATFIRLFLVPINLNADYDFPLSKSFFELQTFLSFIAVLSVFIIGFLTRKKNVLVSFGILWFFVTFLPNFVPRSDVIFEHKLYLISVGFCIAVSSLLFKLIEDQKVRMFIVCFIVAEFSLITYQRNKVWENSLTLWQDVVKKSPNKARGHNNLGAEFIRRGKYDLALVEANKTLELNAGYYKAYYNRGIAYYNYRLYEKAIKDFKKSIELKPIYHDAYNYLGIYYFNNGNIDLALDNYNKALEFNPNYVSAYNNRGMIYLNKRKFDLALSDFNKALSLDDKHIKAYYNRGNLYYVQGQYDKAIEEYNKVIKLDPGFVEVLNNRGILYLNMGKVDMALSDFKKALSINKDYERAYYNIGDLYRSQKKYELAYEYYNKTINVNPDFLEAYNSLGDLYFQEKKYELALKEFDKAIAVNPGHGMAYYFRGNLNKALNNYEQALEDYNKSLETSANNPEVLYSRGELYELLGESEKARADFDKVLNTSSGFVDTYYNQSIDLKRENKDELAISGFSRVINVDEKNADAYNNRGNIYGKKGQYDLALADYNMAIKHDPAHAKAFNNRGTVYRVKEKLDLALSDYNRAIELDPEYAFCYLNRSLVYSSLGKYDRALDDALNAKVLGHGVDQKYI